jgi:uncharacterized protein YbjT (DUF2867 family)
MLALLLFALMLFAYIENVVSMRVLVTGAAGRTGSLALKKLLNLKNQSSSIEAIGLVNSKKSLKKVKKLAGASDSQIRLADITLESTLDSAFQGVDAVILATSAVPQIKIFSLIKAMVFKVFGKQVRPSFTFPRGQPYDVDWLGAKNQIDAAKKAGVKHFIFISSMGGTQPDNFLNTIGRDENNDKSGNILLWKRKAEEYLVNSGIPYTIIHPGGLIDKPGGERELLLGVNDELLSNPKDRTIPRSDVAEVAIQALFTPEAKGRSIDIVSRPPGEGKVTTDWKAFFSSPGKYKY